MFQVVLVDDNLIFLTEAKAEIEKILEGEDVQVKMYDSPRGFREDLGKGSFKTCGLYLLDLEMPEISGLALAEIIRETDEDAVLVFLTNHERFALDGYRVEARRYFLKTDWKAELGEWLPDFYRKWKKNRREADPGYWYDYDGIQCRIPVRDISALEYDNWNHQVLIDTGGEVFRERKSLKNLLEELDSEDFVQVRKGCAVHLGHVKKLAGDEIFLRNGHAVRLSRNYKKDFLERYKQYIGRKV